MTTLEERVAQAIAFALAINTDLPDWMQTPALGRDTLPLGELAAPAVVALMGEVLADLRERLAGADGLLLDNAAHAASAMYGDHDIEAARMRAKAEGVRLALSYLDEAMKETGR